METITKEKILGIIQPAAPRYNLRTPLSGGRAGKWKNKTSNIQVFDIKKFMIKKQFKYTVMDLESKKDAIEKAKAFINTLKPKK
jgi:hypothetical protein